VNRKRIRVTSIWVCGLIVIFTLGILWLGSFGLAVFKVYKAHDADEVAGRVAIFGFVLVILGAALKQSVDRFHQWHSDQRLNSVLNDIDERVSKSQAEEYIDNLTLDFSSEFSETFKRQLRSSSTFQHTVVEAKKLLGEFVAFSVVSHTDEQWNIFRKAWQAKNEAFANRIVQDDPLAVQVILKAIEKESQRSRV
jgi:hypothetical protein